MTFRDEGEPGTIGQIILHTNSNLNSVLDNYEPQTSNSNENLENNFFHNRGNNYSDDVDDGDDCMSIPRDDSKIFNNLIYFSKF